MSDQTTNNTSDDIESLKDEEILTQSLQQPALFEILVERYQAPLWRAAMRVVHNKEEAEDIVQEAFLKMYRNAEKFEKLDGIEFKSWAYKIAINTAITHYRKLKKGEILSEDPAELAQPDLVFPDIGLSFAADAKAAVKDVFQKMPDHLRTVLERYYLEDKSYHMIAAEENISISTLKMRLFRARRLFKKLSDGVEL